MADWAVRVTRAQGRLHQTLADGRDLAEGCPVDLLLAAAGACFALSCATVAAAKSLPLDRLTAEVTGTRAPDRPSRLGGVEIRWSMPDLPPAQAARIAQDAKRICTVTNSLDAPVTLIP